MKRMLVLSFMAMLLALAGCVSEEKMTWEKAREAAQMSDCMKVGNLTNESFYNNNTKTWWFGLDTLKPGCSPACVVSENKSAQVNWRCTGAIPPENETEYCSKPCHISIGQVNYTETPPSCTGSGQTLMCTMEYRYGDVCLRYLNCTIDDDTCTTTTDPKFHECIACFENETLENISSVSSCEDKYQQ